MFNPEHPLADRQQSGELVAGPSRISRFPGVGRERTAAVRHGSRTRNVYGAGLGYPVRRASDVGPGITSS
jgi:hypothetical protein